MAVNLNGSENQERISLRVNSDKSKSIAVIENGAKIAMVGSGNQGRVPLQTSDGGLARTMNFNAYSPYYVGARAYVEQNSDGAVVTVIDKDGTTTATILNGIDGRSIASIEKTSSVGLIDTYTITFTDGSTMTFDITKGNDVEALTNEEIEELLT